MGWWIAGVLSRGVKVRRVAVAAIMRPVPAPSGIGAVNAATGGAPAAAMVSLAMHFSQDSWTEVYDATGKRLLYDTGSAGSTRTVSGVPPLRVVLGNAPAVSLKLDGEPLTVPDLARNRLSTFQVSASGRVARLGDRRGHDASQDSRP
jgi:cytoskeleton protein RodZ